MFSRPADNMTGVVLPDGWTVAEKIAPAPTATGGHFSIGYRAVHSSGEEGFLKALDFSSAFAAADPTLELQAMTEAYNLECMLLEKCAGRKLKRIVTPISKGSVLPPHSASAMEKVFYIIFEKAEGDIRRFHDKMILLDVAWCFRSLHHTALGIMQLHKVNIAHQDLKPSNVLYFSAEGSKINDLGRSTDADRPSKNDLFAIPGDMGYAPPELFYNHRCHSDFRFRKAVDLYLLGSLVFFHFLKVSAMHMLKLSLNSLGVSLTRSFQSDLPFFQQAFAASLDELRKAVTPIAGKSTDMLIQIASELCNPDPSKRGNLSITATDQYSAQRYVSQFDVLAKRAELGFL